MPFTSFFSYCSRSGFLSGFATLFLVGFEVSFSLSSFLRLDGRTTFLPGLRLGVSVGGVAVVVVGAVVVERGPATVGRNDGAEVRPAGGSGVVAMRLTVG